VSEAICEYACAVLENCGLGIYNKLDPLQVGAARIVTGLPIFASSILIYKELGWESLTERRKRRKLQMFYNICSTCIFHLASLLNVTPKCL
jgi:hypothetical protein